MNNSLLDVLVRNNVVTKEELPAIQAELEKAEKGIDDILIEKGINPEDILDAKSEYYGIPSRNMDGQKVPIEILKYIPEESATHYKFVPIGVNDGVLEVGFVDPDNIEARDALTFISTKNNMPFKIFLITEEDFRKVIASYHGFTGEVNEAISELEKEFDTANIEESKSKESRASVDFANMRIVEDAPVTKIVSNMLSQAVDQNASDIHVEPMEDKVRIRYRVDGTLNTSLELPIRALSALVARIKILSSMRLDEKRKPQDGRFYANINGRKIDFRVSTFPAYYGEKVVMRILDSQKGVKPVESMGLSPRNLKLIKASIERPYGMILISGPTGSGKSTTLYSMINLLDRDHENVLSLEDPVEYHIPGMNQSQVRPEIGYTFASGLRTTLRQDPDIIMVGEIRDKETAQLAVQAALTGHLVLSTIHTNSAAGVIPRLIDMGVDPFLIAPTLIMAVAQRLVKKLPPSGGRQVKVEGHVKEIIDLELKQIPEKFRKDIKVPEFIYEPEPSPDYPMGTTGRTAVIEIIDVTEDMQRVILKNPVEMEIMKVAREQGMLTMREDAMLKAFNKEIPFEEVVSL